MFIVQHYKQPSQSLIRGFEMQWDVKLSKPTNSDDLNLVLNTTITTLGHNNKD